MIIINLMLAVWFIFTCILLSGVKMMYNCKYFQSISTMFIMYIPISSAIEGYRLGEISIKYVIIISIIFLITLIWTYRGRSHTYSIHNVNEDDVINIIENYLERKNIKYEIRSEEIFLPNLYKTIFVRHAMQTVLDCKGIKDTDFYNELIDSVRVGIKKINKRYFSMEGIFNLIFILFFFWIKLTFLK